MHLPLRLVTGLLVAGLATHSSQQSHKTTMSPPGNHTRSRALSIEKRQDAASYQGYYPYPPAPYPTYGPPPTEIPPGSVHLEFAFDQIVLRCVAEEPFEHIIWTRYQCPQQFLFGGEGEHVADGSSVYQPTLYDVHIRGHDGTIVSELLIKNPLAQNSEGIYQCEVWPHIHGTGHSYSHYHPPKSDVFIIGGNSLLEDCYRFHGYGANKLSSVGATGTKDMKTQNMPSLKPRRNVTQSREDSDLKQLRYSLEYDNNTVYDINGENVTADFFRPSYKAPVDVLYKFPKNLRPRAQKHLNNLSSFALDFTRRNNDKFRDIYNMHKQAQTTTTNIDLHSNYSSI